MSEIESLHEGPHDTQSAATEQELAALTSATTTEFEAMDTSLLDAQPTAKYPTGSNRIAVLMAIVAALGPLDFGVTLGFTSPSIIGMEAGANGTWASEAVFDDAVVIKGEVSSNQAALFGSMVNVGAMIGAMLGGPLADTIGRKLAIATAAVPWIAAWLAIGLGSSFGVVLAGRMLSGVAVGITSMCVPLYITETAPASLRGALGAVNQVRNPLPPRSPPPPQNPTPSAARCHSLA